MILFWPPDFKDHTIRDPLELELSKDESKTLSEYIAATSDFSYRQGTLAMRSLTRDTMKLLEDLQREPDLTRTQLE